MHVEWNRLDAAAFRVSMKRSVRRFAWYAAIAGAVVVACGIGGRSVPLTAIGLVLAGAGAWNLRRPSITGLLVDGVAMILAGAFQCLTWAWLDDARPSSVGKWVIAGLFQIAWGIRRIALYPTARLAVDDPEAIARLESLVREVSRRDARSDPAVAEFRTGGFRRRRNRLGLHAEGVIGLLEHQAVRLEKRADVWIEAIGTTALGRVVRVRIQMSDLQLTGEMPAEHLERFERWKAGATGPSALAA